MARKGENIYYRKDGRWEGRYALARNMEGKIRYGYVYGRSYKETKEKLIIKKANSFFEYKRVSRKEDVKTVENWIEMWKDTIIRYQVKKSTYASYSYKLKNYTTINIKKKKISQLRKSDIEEMIIELKEKGLSNRTINTFLQIFSECIDCAQEKEYITNNPCRQIKKLKNENKEVKPLSNEEQLLIESVAKKEQYGIIILLPLFTGMRIGEISALEWDDIDFNNKIIKVNKTLQRIPRESNEKKRTEISIGTTKSNKVRYIPISNSLFQLLSEYREKNSFGKYVVSNKIGYMEPRLITYHFKKMLKKVKMSEINYHALRHTFATRCVENGVDVVTLCKLLGHTSVKTTLDIYTDSMMEQRVQAISKLDFLKIENKPS